MRQILKRPRHAVLIEITAKGKAQRSYPRACGQSATFVSGLPSERQCPHRATSNPACGWTTTIRCRFWAAECGTSLVSRAILRRRRIRWQSRLPSRAARPMYPIHSAGAASGNQLSTGDSLFVDRNTRLRLDRAIQERKRWLWLFAVALSAIQTYGSFGPAPQSPLAEAHTVLFAYLALGLLAGLVEWSRRGASFVDAAPKPLATGGFSS